MRKSLPRLVLFARQKTFWMWVFSGLLTACSSVEPTPDIQPKPITAISVRPQNIILIIGSGVGLSQISAGMYSQGDRTHLERCTASGLHKPLSIDGIITGAAAGATAFSIGLKTYQGAIGVGPDSMAVPNVMEQARAQGWLTGIVTTGSLTDPTPASFYAHVKQQEQRAEIASKLATSGLNFFVGAGLEEFSANTRAASSSALSQLSDEGYVLSDYTRGDLANFQLPQSRKVGYFTANTAPETTQNMPYDLPLALKKATAFFTQTSVGEGFFLLLSTGKTAEAASANNSPALIAEMIQLDQTVGMALDFAEQDKETLVLITGDREVGGYALKIGSSRDSILGGFTTGGSTASLIPVFAFGPGAELFNGVFDNFEIYTKLRIAMGF